VPLQLVPARDAHGREFTWYGKGETFPPARFDHLLVSRPLAARLVRPQAVIWNDAAAEIASDHRPVYIDIAVPKDPTAFKQ
jgi:endonuclease/exonuclease/phosphatase family metal-dependent hydrolase